MPFFFQQFIKGILSTVTIVSRRFFNVHISSRPLTFLGHCPSVAVGHIPIANGEQWKDFSDTIPSAHFRHFKKEGTTRATIMASWHIFLDKNICHLLVILTSIPQLLAIAWTRLFSTYFSWFSSLTVVHANSYLKTEK